MDDTKTDAIETMEGDNKITFLLVDGNQEYEEYKLWVAEGNTAEAAD